MTPKARRFPKWVPNILISIISLLVTYLALEVAYRVYR
jgi:hypothetical protein